MSLEKGNNATEVGAKSGRVASDRHSSSQWNHTGAANIKSNGTAGAESRACR